MHLSNAPGKISVRQNSGGEVEENGESAVVFRRLLLTVQDFVNFKDHCGQRKGPTVLMHEIDSCAPGPLDWLASEHSQEQECSVLSLRRGEPAASTVQTPLDEHECELLAATESEVQKLMEDLQKAQTTAAMAV